MMTKRRIRSVQDLEALPEGEWVKVAGMDVEWVEEPPRGRSARVVIPLDANIASSLAPRPGEVLEARLKGRQLELVRRRRRRSQG
jgi:hypothetical protein